MLGGLLTASRHKDGCESQRERGFNCFFHFSTWFVVRVNRFVNLFPNSLFPTCERVNWVTLHCSENRESVRDGYPGVVGFST